MADLYDFDGLALIIYSVENSIVTLADSILLLTSNLFVPWWPWILRELLDSADNPAKISLRKFP